MDAALNDILADWTLPVWLTAAILVTAAVYLRGWFAIRRTRPAQFTTARLASFLAGLTVLWLAIGSPMDGLADALLSAHMVEHLLLMSFVPPLVLWGSPVVPLLRGLPAPIRRYVAAPLIRTAALRRLAHFLTQPAVAWIAMNACFLLWHIPAAYDFALEHEAWHDFEHITFLATSLLFWWCILRPWPARPRRHGFGMLVYMVGADLVNTILSALLAFCGRPVYAYYLENPNPFHTAALADQMLGAVVMWVVGSIVFLVPAMLIASQLAGFSSPLNGRESERLLPRRG